LESVRSDPVRLRSESVRLLGLILYASTRVRSESVRMHDQTFFSFHQSKRGGVHPSCDLRRRELSHLPPSSAGSENTPPILAGVRAEGCHGRQTKVWRHGLMVMSALSKVIPHKTLVRVVLMDPPLICPPPRRPHGRHPAAPAPCAPPSARSGRNMHRGHTIVTELKQFSISSYSIAPTKSRHSFPYDLGIVRAAQGRRRFVRNLFKDVEEAHGMASVVPWSARHRLVLHSTPCCRRYCRQHRRGGNSWRDHRRGPLHAVGLPHSTVLDHPATSCLLPTGLTTAALPLPAKLALPHQWLTYLQWQRTCLSSAKVRGPSCGYTCGSEALPPTMT
jgi:hypothetical protein